ncbi:right-handed parallel beta-helix repeat-containing protein [Glacieibacterium sp.]|uniref:right-handed parallel beta-helix repeat-containing protein n=1 Tax=Glacieibacterium sp. TaxID=2860237 RepID=UPI003B0022A6
MSFIAFMFAAAGLSVTPAMLPARLQAALPGNVLALSQADFGPLLLNDVHYDPPLVIDGGRFTKIVIRAASGVVLRNSTVVADGGYGVQVVQSSNVRIEGLDVSGAKRGVVIDRTSDFAITRGNFHGLVSDGIDIAQSRRGLIAENTMSDFHPIPPIYDASGKLFKDGDHPDGIQAWSRSDLPATADIKVLRNKISGSVQCVFFGNHVRDVAGVPTDDGGFDRIEVRDNICRNAMPRGITLSSARNSVIEGNDAAALPGARLLRTGKAIKSQVLISGEGSRACGNIVADVPRSPAAQPCSRRDE